MAPDPVGPQIAKRFGLRHEVAAGDLSAHASRYEANTLHDGGGVFAQLAHSGSPITAWIASSAVALLLASSHNAPQWV